MPTTIANRGKKFKPPKPGGELALTSYTIKPPWLGYCPDLNHVFGGLTAFENAEGLVNQDGQLTIDLGWGRLEGDPVSLPLGGDGVGPLHPADPDAAPQEVQPVTLIAELSRSDGDADKLALFAATSTVAGGASAIGFCWWLDPGPPLDWTPVPFAGAGTAITNGTRDEPFDWAPYPRGGTVIANLRPGAMFFTNYVDEVYMWDITSAAGPPGTYISAFTNTLDGQNFYAKSVETFWERLVFLNTRESHGGGGVGPFVKRVRWTDVAVAPNLVGTGTGFIDFTEFKGDGLRVLAFQDLCACYFEDGVGRLRRTGLPNNPYQREYISKERGLLGTFAVVRVANDLHFGLFTDGWFYLAGNGVWREAGTIDTGAGTAHKWARTFLNLLDSENKHRIALNFDKLTRRIQITFPLANGGETTWVYDMDTDSVWPDDPYTAVTWGEATTVLSAGLDWDDMPDTWAITEGRWVDYGTVYGDRASLHGTEDGLIFFHSPLATLRDGDQVNWLLRSHLEFFEDPYDERVTDRFLLEHGITNVDRNVSIGYRNQKNDYATRSVNFNTGEGGTITTSLVHKSLRGYGIGTAITGQGAVRLFNMQVTFRPSAASDRESS